MGDKRDPDTLTDLEPGVDPQGGAVQPSSAAMKLPLQKAGRTPGKVAVPDISAPGGADLLHDDILETVDLMTDPKGTI